MGEFRPAAGVAVVAFLLFLVLFVTGLAPFDYEFPLPGIEGGWLAASVYAGLHHLAYGTQFVFTNGPLFPLYHREFAGELSIWYSLGRAAIAVFLALAMARLTVGAAHTALLVALVIFVLFWPSIPWHANDGLLVLVPLLVALLVLGPRGPTWLILAGIVLTAAIGLAKFSLVSFAVGALLVCDLALLGRRRLPYALVTFAVASFGLFVATGQSPAAFVPYLQGSLDITASYTAALAVDGPWWELALFLLSCTLILLALGVTELRLVRRGEDTPREALLRLLLVAGLVGFSLKAGFVRHDGHSVAAWVAMAFLTAMLALPATFPGWRPRRAVLYLALPALLMAVVFGYTYATGWLWRDLTTTAPRILASQLADAVTVLRDPSGWLAKNQARADSANAALRDWLPLPPLTGRVDSLSNVQSAVIAAGLDYSPRPTIQENMTYSPALIARNRAYLTGPDAPDTLLFAPGATDGRHPASIEGALWPMLLADYAVTASAGDQLILHRRLAPRPVVEAPLDARKIGFGETIPLPASGVVFLRLGIDQSIWGKLADIAFKAPLVVLETRDADGKSQTYRLIPGMISEGMLIAPTIATAAAYRSLDAGGDLAGPPRPTSLRVLTDGNWAFAPTISLSLSTLTIPPG